MENNKESYPVPHKHHWYNEENHPEQIFPKVAPKSYWGEYIAVAIACAVILIIPFIPMVWSAGISVLLATMTIVGHRMIKKARNKGIMFFQQGIVTPHEFPGIHAATQAAIDYSNILQVEELSNVLILHCRNVTSMDAFDPERIWPTHIVDIEPLDKLFVRDALFRKVKDNTKCSIYRIEEDSHRTVWEIREPKDQEDTNNLKIWKF